MKYWATLQGLTISYENHPYPEITAEEFFRDEEEEQIINNNNMSQQTEIELELVKQPQKAKNLTVGNIYKGIYIDDEETQVDHRKDAKYFYCVNDSGAEARYLVDLFAPVSKKAGRPAKEKVAPTPPPPPPQPRVYNIEEVIASLNVSDGNVTAILRENGSRVPILGRGYSTFTHNGSGISCGVHQITNLNNTWDIIFRDFHVIGAIAINDDIKKSVYKALLIAKIRATASCRFFMMSTQTERGNLCEAIDEVVEELGGVSIVGNNPNSGNEIKVWTITKP